MLAPVDEPLIEALRLDAPYRVADVGCGGGGTALEIERNAPKGTVVHGFDISPAMVEAARARAREERRGTTFDVADVASRMAAAPYQRLSSRFGVMFFRDPMAAFANLRRWLAPGGRFAFAVWADPADNPWTTSVGEAVASVIDLPVSEPDAPGPFRYAEVGRLVTLLEQAALAEIEVRTWQGELAVGGELSPREAAHFALSSFSTYAERLADAGGDAFDTAHRALTARFAKHHRDGAVRMNASVHMVTGVRAD
ncbi:class I SAM-dependent methyltransferase [Haliangium sp.]|uniref:class I SAM-dependent methyltransferase n=1 Tax=Haliangium sp. TaxID=2663208 RepID=UPI003D09914C